MAAAEQLQPLQPDQPAPDFTLPAVDRAGTVSLAEYRGRGPLLLSLMRGLQCPFCRRNVMRLGAVRRKLRELGVETLAVFATTPERARLYARYRPIPVPAAADPELATHRAYGVPCYPVTPELIEGLKSTRVDPFRELAQPVPFIGPRGEEIHDVFDRLDGFVPNETDQRDRTRQFRESLQLCAQFLVDRAGVIRWVHVERESGGLADAGKFPTDEEFLAAARAIVG